MHEHGTVIFTLKYNHGLVVFCCCSTSALLKSPPRQWMPFLRLGCLITRQHATPLSHSSWESLPPGCLAGLWTSWLLQHASSAPERCAWPCVIADSSRWETQQVVLVQQGARIQAASEQRFSFWQCYVWSLSSAAARCGVCRTSCSFGSRQHQVATS